MEFAFGNNVPISPRRDVKKRPSRTCWGGQSQGQKRQVSPPCEAGVLCDLRQLPSPLWTSALSNVPTILSFCSADSLGLPEIKLASGPGEQRQYKGDFVCVSLWEYLVIQQDCSGDCNVHRCGESFTLAHVCGSQL